jgi:hypothetical protein
VLFSPVYIEFHSRRSRPTLQTLAPISNSLFSKSNRVSYLPALHSITSIESNSYKNTGNRRPFPPFSVLVSRSHGHLSLHPLMRSLHQECFTTLLQSGRSTLLLKTAGCHPGEYPHTSRGTLTHQPSPFSSTIYQGKSQLTVLAHPGPAVFFGPWPLLPGHSPPPSVPLHPTSLGATMANGARFLHRPGKQLCSTRCLRIVSGHREPFDGVPGLPGFVG